MGLNAPSLPGVSEDSPGAQYSIFRRWYAPVGIKGCFSTLVAQEVSDSFIGRNALDMRRVVYLDLRSPSDSSPVADATCSVEDR